MDPLTHLLIGSGVAGMAGNSLNLSNPAQIGAMIGSLTPDFDILLQLKGDMFYLKHHRGFSHSIPGISLFSAITAIALKLFFPMGTLGNIFLWTLLGNLSHIIVDVFNSYGAEIFWPISKKKFTFNLLMIFDPIIILIFSGLFFERSISSRFVGVVSFALLSGYLMFRWFLRLQVEKYLGHKFRRREINKIIVMPALYSILGWDFFIETPQEFIVGHVRGFSWKTGLRSRLAKEKANLFLETAMESKIGQLFQEFTPYFHISHWREGNKHIIKFTDLRYFIKSDFMHSATLILNHKYDIIEGVFHPYSKNRHIKIGC